MTVYFIQEPSPKRTPPDITTAHAYGQVKFVFDYKFPVSQKPETAYAHAEEVLKDFDPREDFIADCGGDKMALGVVTHILADWEIIKFLRWNRYDGGSYEPTYIGRVDGGSRVSVNR